MCILWKRHSFEKTSSLFNIYHLANERGFVLNSIQSRESAAALFVRQILLVMCFLPESTPAKRFGFFDPGEALLPRARNDHCEHFAVEHLDTAELEDASPPDGLQGIAEYGLLS